MKIHEYQANEILRGYGVPSQEGFVISDKSEVSKQVENAKKSFGSEEVVVKAQIHAGGRGKGGGVKIAKNSKDAVEKANEIMGMTLVTPQTGKEGRLVKKVLLTRTCDIKKEYYLAITLDRAKAKNVIIASQSGGMDIETVAHKDPEKIYKEWIDPTSTKLPLYKAFNVSRALGLEKNPSLHKAVVQTVTNLYRCYLETDASILEINPLVVTNDEKLVALDAKFNFDDNALFRHKDYQQLRDLNEEDQSEIEAAKYNLNFIKLDGNVGCMVNGAGLAMATMDLIKQMGGEPANFLDVGGTASVETVKNAFRIILGDDKVKVVLVNIFGGIVRCDRVAGGIIEAVKDLKLSIPIVVRLAGTNADIAKNLLEEARLSIVPALSFHEAAQKAVALVKG